ncbi:MAG: hypothetical protein KIT56_10490 [Gammaproteobacteria bacterium]|nr:hypothetical protein [Gammaproteobacteria bacterium]MCW5584276.1 hypothetical protein [Gammaproteobacteria bacterium]
MDTIQDDFGKETLICEIERTQLASSIANSTAGFSNTLTRLPSKIDLFKKSFSELLKIYEEVLNEENDFITKRIAHKEKQAFYNKPEAQAEMDYWNLFETLTADQLTALSLGKDPRIVTLDKIKTMPEEFSFKRIYLDRHALLLQSLFKSKLEISMPEFFKWAKPKNLTLPAAIITTSKKAKGTIAEINTDEALAYMAKIIAACKPSCMIKGRPNALAIGKLIDSMAMKHNKGASKFKSFHKRLSKALKDLENK